MNQVKIGVKTPATVHAFQFAEASFKVGRETGNEVHGYKPVQLLESGYHERILNS